MTPLNDQHILILKEFGYSIESSDVSLKINRPIHIPLFIWLLGAAFGVILILYPFSFYSVLLGVVFVLSPLNYRRNVATEIIFDRSKQTISYKTGLFKISYNRSFNDVDTLRLKTYDVSSYASPFTSGTREYIAELKLDWKKRGSVEIFFFNRRSKQEIGFVDSVHTQLADYYEFKNTISHIS